MATSVRKLFIYGSFAFVLGGGYKYLYKPWRAARQAPQQEVLRPEANRVLPGAFVNHYADIARVRCFEKMSGHKLKLVARFTSFQELRANRPFPPEAKTLRAHGIPLFLILEPGSGKGAGDFTYSLSRIASGDFDKYLISFGKAAYRYNGPVMLTLRPWHGLNATPDEVLAAYRHIREKILSTGARNITWVWSVNLNGRSSLEKLPPENEYGWIAVTAYETAGLDQLAARLAELKKTGKPILVEFGSSLPGKDKADYLRKAEARFKEWGIDAYIFNGVDQVEDGVLKHRSLTGAEERAAFTVFNELPLAKDVRIRGGQLEDETGGRFVDKTDCSKIEGQYFSVDTALRIEELRRILAKNEEFLHGTIGGDPHYYNKRRLELAQACQDLFFITREDKYRLQAEQILEEIFKNPDPVLIYDPEEGYVREYFESRLRFANYYFSISSRRALSSIDQIMADLERLEKTRFFNPQQGRKESIPGFYHKALAIKARILESNGRHEEAEALYRTIANWTNSEAGGDIFSTLPFIWESTWFRGEDVDDIGYDGASARIRLGFLRLRAGDQKEALELSKSVLSWSKVGEEDGYMDLGFEALILALQACAESSLNPDGTVNLEQAKGKFRDALPWDRINHYPDLLKALGIGDLSKLKKWDAILDGLALVDLPAGQQILLQKLRGYPGRANR